jgi:hypothetical protein
LLTNVLVHDLCSHTRVELVGEWIAHVWIVLFGSSGDNCFMASQTGALTIYISRMFALFGRLIVIMYLVMQEKSW